MEVDHINRHVMSVMTILSHLISKGLRQPVMIKTDPLTCHADNLDICAEENRDFVHVRTSPPWLHNRDLNLCHDLSHYFFFLFFFARDWKRKLLNISHDRAPGNPLRLPPDQRNDTLPGPRGRWGCRRQHLRTPSSPGVTNAVHWHAWSSQPESQSSNCRFSFKADGESENVVHEHTWAS